MLLLTCATATGARVPPMLLLPSGTATETHKAGVWGCKVNTACRVQLAQVVRIQGWPLLLVMSG